MFAEKTEIETPRMDILEPHFTCAELAKAWHLAWDTVRSWFMDEPGVIRFGAGKLNKKRTRTYITLRIPASVARRVYKKYTSQEPRWP